MESVDTHPCNKLFPKAAPDNDQACGYFRIRELSTGKVVSNVSQSIGHNFCSALADHKRDTLWVFCSAFARRNKLNPGPCAHGYNGCYVGGWKTKLSGDLNTWSRTAKVLTLPGGMGMANNDATLVSGAAAVAAALIPGAAPPHQAVMIIEGRGNWSRGVPYPEFAINTGTVRKALEREDTERTLMRGFSRRTPSVSSLSLSLVTMTHQYDTSVWGSVGAPHQCPLARLHYTLLKCMLTCAIAMAHKNEGRRPVQELGAAQCQHIPDWCGAWETNDRRGGYRGCTYNSVRC